MGKSWKREGFKCAVYGSCEGRCSPSTFDRKWQAHLERMQQSRRRHGISMRQLARFGIPLAVAVLQHKIGHRRMFNWIPTNRQDNTHSFRAGTDIDDPRCRLLMTGSCFQDHIWQFIHDYQPYHQADSPRFSDSLKKMIILHSFLTSASASSSSAYEITVSQV